MNGLLATTGGPRTLTPGAEVCVIACERRPAMGTKGRCLGVRWASLPALGFPTDGYRLWRIEPGSGELAAGQDRRLIGTFTLPATTDWPSFSAAAADRRPARGPYFDVIEEAALGFLLPLIRLADLRTPEGERPALVTQAAGFFGDTHQSDAELAWKLWRLGQAPPLANLLADSVAAPLVTIFYWHAVVDFLLVLALRFEYAALLGLGCDDQPPAVPVSYEVEAQWGKAVVGRAASRTVDPGATCSPQAPQQVWASRAPGSVAHPAFLAWPGWTPPPAYAPRGASGSPLPAGATIPRAPAALSALAWSAPDIQRELIGYGPVLYLASRYTHGEATAGQVATPAVPPGSVFAPVGDGEPVIRPRQEPHLLDTPGMDWPPLEGHCTYEVRGMDLLGTVSTDAGRGSVRHHDDIAPPSPRARSTAGVVLTVPAGAATVQVPLAIDWDAAEDFGGPDASEFRVMARWTPLQAIGVHVEQVRDAGILHADLTLTSLPGQPDQYVGVRLSTTGTEYPIVSHGSGAPATMRVRKVQGQSPTAGSEGLILAAAAATPLTRVACLTRRPAVPATVISATLAAGALELELQAAAAQPLPVDAQVRSYLHLLRTSFDATQLGPGRWRIEPPPAGSPAAERWGRLLDDLSAARALAGSPAILFPPHQLTLGLALPPAFGAGLLTLSVTAADGASYVSSPSLPVAEPALAGPRGNESARTEVIVSVRSLAPPAQPPVAAWIPGQRLWATSAAAYAESAHFDLTWSAVAAAARFEVWRALEGNVRGAMPATTDADLRALAAAQPEAFGLRSDQVFGTHFVDDLPGRAPTRALYRIRSVSAGGQVSAPSALIGPVYVPDVRPPTAPNLLRAAAAPPAEADRAIAVEWTQAGPTDDVRFEVLFRAVDAAASEPFAVAGRVAVGTAPGPVGRFRFLHRDRPPGKRFAYRVEAVREAADPIDPAGAVKRDIRSLGSQELVAFAISSAPLVPPSGLAAALAGSDVTLSWSNRDDYRSIEIRRRAAGRYAFQVVATLAGDAVEHVDAAVPGGTWSYQLRAVGISREARTETELKVVIP